MFNILYEGISTSNQGFFFYETKESESPNFLSIADVTFNKIEISSTCDYGKNVLLFEPKDIPQDVVVPPSRLSRQDR